MATKAPEPIEEGLLRFEFDSSWQLAFKWDTDQCPEFVDGLRRLDGVKHVDIVGTRHADELWLIEIKDPRGHQIEYRKTRAQDLPRIVADKVRDTIAGVVYAIGRFAPDRCHDLGKVLLATKKSTAGAIYVVLWLEGIDAPSALALKDKIAGQFKWLNAKILVTNRQLWQRATPPAFRAALSVTSLPGASPIASK